MSKVEALAVERIIANTISETPRGDPDALAARIVAALAEAGYRILPPHGRENAAPRPPRPEPRQLYRSPNGDSWFLARDPETGSAFVRHQANAPSGGQVTDRYRTRHVPQWASKSRARSPTAPDWRINLQSAGGRGR